MRKFRKTAAFLLACLLLGTAFLQTGCDWNSPNGEGGRTAGGEVWRLNRAGVSIPVPAAYAANKALIYIETIEDLFWEEGVAYGGLILYPASGEALDKMSSDERAEISAEISFPVLFFAIDGNRGPEELAEWMTAHDSAEMTDDMTEVGRVEDWTFYRVRFDEMMLSYEGKAGDAAKAVADALAGAEFVFFKPEIHSDGQLAGGDVISFTTTDLDGNPVDSAELFAAADITMVNIWTSWCGYCVQEMPELEAIGGRLAEKGCQLIGILFDGDTAEGLADGRDVIRQTGATYLMLMPTAEIVAAFPVQGYPTTFFVNSAGQIVGTEIVGAQVDRYEPAVDKLLGK